MPNKVLRQLLVTLLVAMVPVQGLAALSMGICRDLQEGAHGMVHANAAPAKAKAHGHASVDDSAGLADDADSELAHCAACAGCGVSAGIDVHAAFSIVEAPREGVIAHRISRSPGFVPDAPYRPPLTMLA